MKAIPRTNAKTAYGWLSFVRKLILEEPKRYTQGRYIARIGGKNDSDPIGGDCPIDARKVPACGTVGCVAGWVATLARGHKFTYSQAGRIAQKVLDLDSDQYDELFNGGAVGGVGQTLEHARMGAKHIADFQKRYSQQLRARVIPRELVKR